MKKLILTMLMTTFCFTAYAGPQQDEMKAWNADPKAKTLKCDERKAFMKSCLYGNLVTEKRPNLKGPRVRLGCKDELQCLQLVYSFKFKLF